MSYNYSITSVSSARVAYRKMKEEPEFYKGKMRKMINAEHLNLDFSKTKAYIRELETLKKSASSCASKMDSVINKLSEKGDKSDREDAKILKNNFLQISKEFKAIAKNIENTEADFKAFDKRMSIEADKVVSGVRIGASGLDFRKISFKHSGIINLASPEGASGLSLKPDEIAYSPLEKNLMEQFGFDGKTAQTIGQVRTAIDAKYPLLPQKERDWMFLRAISSLKYNHGENFDNQWEIGAGTVISYGKNDAEDYANQKNYFVDELGLSEADFKRMRYNVRLQGELAGGTVNHEPNEVFESKGGLFSKGNNAKFKEAMEKAYGYTLTQEKFREEYKRLYAAYYGKGDFAHFMYTVAGGLVDTEKNSNVPSEFSKFGVTLWSSHDERKEYIGWLGDATFTKAGFAKPIFGRDDYIADLDADNIVKRMEKDSGLSLDDALTGYYSEDYKNRAVEFLENNPDVEKRIFSAAGVDSMEELKKKWPATYKFLSSLKAKKASYN